VERKSHRLGRVRDLAETEEREHCRTMGAAQQALDAHERRLEELETYRREYAARGAAAGEGASLSSARYADYQNFLKRLDDAVRAQSQVVMTNRQNRDAHRDRWLAKRRRAESLGRVVDRYLADEARADDRRLQKSLDDLPSRPGPFESSRD